MKKWWMLFDKESARSNSMVIFSYSLLDFLVLNIMVVLYARKYEMLFGPLGFQCLFSFEMIKRGFLDTTSILFWCFFVCLFCIWVIYAWKMHVILRLDRLSLKTTRYMMLLFLKKDILFLLIIIDACHS